MKRRSSRRVSNGQQGYALLVVVFLATLMLLATVVVAPNIQTYGKREQEKEMIWRGNQYVRGVKLYYRKLGRFPTSLDDLTKPKVGSLRFMRQPYKDPMNKQDGSWRFIYVGPNGQLIGSLKPHPLSLQMPQQSAAGTGPTASPVGAPNSQLGGTSSGASGQIGPQSGAAPGTGQTNSGTSSQAAGATSPSGSASTGSAVGTDQSSADSPQPSLADTSNIIGGNIIGVGSKIDKPSIIVYDKAKKYLQFEFIWDPSKDLGVVGQQGQQIGTPVGQPAGQSPFGQSPMGPSPGNMPQNPQPNTPQTPQQ